MELKTASIQGVKLNYYYICKRKLWLFAKGISMEHNSDRVLSGKVIHENSYPRMKKREVLIDGLVKLDIVDGDYIREVKISSKMSKADRMQLLYYLYYLKEKGVEKKGLINYVKERRVEEIELTEDDELEIEKAVKGIEQVLQLKSPPEVINARICKKCAYYLFCYVEEED
ncbi:CRISPR-associated protein Cas4 [Iocasia frigidifontis]|uniref:CRISPR-associated exonuclease Cas4 n=1 Tax=Iocasia fonsfrigidae TaxID=2682810 RepID=A0A8A7KGC7_9FIRM|nr:CRISPR-associated protein Cas4 [Iocasia fonsfrigidae]QTL99145.1 CRISPR-associated protein Cas4 [Iocasia fonsfrigidae]